MSHKRKGQLTVSGEWARHLRPFLRRAFWKGERQAAKEMTRGEDLGSSASRPESESVENLIAQVRSLPPTAADLDLWVPDHLTLRGAPVPLEIAMAVVLDQALERGFEPKGFEPAPGGRLYKYRAQVFASPGDA
jgi:hypothetical protein